MTERDDLMVELLARMVERMTAPTPMEAQANQARRIKKMMAEEDAVSNTVIEEYLRRTKLLSDSELPHGALTDGVRDHPGLGEDGIAVIKAAEAEHQELMDKIAAPYREHYRQPAELPANPRKPLYRTLPLLPAGILPPLLSK
jgi:hypothetical protein